MDDPHRRSNGNNHYLDPRVREQPRRSGVVVPKAGSFWCSSSRLPTPEPSQSGRSEAETESPEGTAAGGLSIRSMLSQVPHINSGDYSSKSGMRRLRGADLPNSPPHRPPVDARRPSLPPLKTVLLQGSSSIDSPPRTPTPPEGIRAFQPSPREPEYRVATYKPPALYYPNKKPRFERTSDAAPALESPVPHRPPAFEPRTEPLAPSTPHVRFPAFDASSCMSRTRHLVGSESPWEMQNQSSRPFSVFVTSHEIPPQPYDHIPTTASRDRRTVQPPSSYRQNSGLSLAGSEFRHQPSTHPDNREGFQNGWSSPCHHHHRQSSIPTFYPLSQHHHHPSHSLQAPTHQYGKIRKRSNLPKQSTEIMKTWFDENISNPYPSEEQKAIFSSATGISLTQVSNWFINHRRRCPELRERAGREGGAGYKGGQQRLDQ